jgi:hypothetical protein
MSPQWNIDVGFPIVEQTVRASGNTGAGQPTMNVSVAALAPFGPPETGASMKIPCLAVTLEMDRDVETEIVELSMKNLGLVGAALLRSPVLESVKTASTWAEDGRLVMIISCGVKVKNKSKYSQHKFSRS